jgi:hypothetical protein
MPLFSVYELAKNYPRKIHYASAVCELELVRGANEKEWIFRAKKVAPPRFCEITKTRYGRYALETVLRQGFVVEDGTPAARILDRLVREGHATRRAASPRDMK